MTRRVAFGLAMTAVLVVAGLGGCSKKAPAKLDPKKVEGTWVELVDTNQASSRRMAPVAPRPYTRKLTINADKTFKMELCDKSGNPIAGKAISGTWEYGADQMNFTVTENKVDAAQQNWKPLNSGGVTGSPTADGSQLDPRLSVMHEDTVITYKKG